MESIASQVKRKEMRIRSDKTNKVFLQDNRGEIVFEPPSGEKVPNLLQNLLEYFEDSCEDPLLKTIVFHANFEMIHPFSDGNGRTGRILNELLLKKSGLLSKPVLCMSRFLVENRRDYYRTIRKIETDGSWNSYLEYMLEGVKESAEHSIALIKDVGMLLEKAYSICEKEKIPKELVELIFTHPYVNSPHR